MEYNISVVIGPMSSTAVKATYPICAGLFMPQIAPIATDAVLSDTQDYKFLLKVRFNQLMLKSFSTNCRLQSLYI